MKKAESGMRQLSIFTCQSTFALGRTRTKPRTRWLLTSMTTATVSIRIHLASIFSFACFFLKFFKEMSFKRWCACYHQTHAYIHAHTFTHFFLPKTHTHTHTHNETLITIQCTYIYFNLKLHSNVK